MFTVCQSIVQAVWLNSSRKSGVAIQRNSLNVKTVHSELVKAIRNLIKTSDSCHHEPDINLHISSRTDRGVSALCNTAVVNLDFNADQATHSYPLDKIENQKWCQNLTYKLNDQFVRNNEHIRLTRLITRECFWKTKLRNKKFHSLKEYWAHRLWIPSFRWEILHDRVHTNTDWLSWTVIDICSNTMPDAWKPKRSNAIRHSWPCAM